ncbi:ATP synthase subunit epsilon, mitochondrial-like [Primulina eburnea]|uniref:ATP synthase subunit epsilon, mitochondrial-like n=1 Tax=Primulina eburnea TaxID=1245227 RepID=UPI003C6C2427
MVQKKAHRQTVRRGKIYSSSQPRRKERGAKGGMASNAAVPFWRSAGMTYITYSNLCANLVRQCLKEPYKSEALNREKVHFSVSQWVDGKPQKPTLRTDTSE